MAALERWAHSLPENKENPSGRPHDHKLTLQDYSKAPIKTILGLKQSKLFIESRYSKDDVLWSEDIQTKDKEKILVLEIKNIKDIYDVPFQEYLEHFEEIYLVAELSPDKEETCLIFGSNSYLNMKTYRSVFILRDQFNISSYVAFNKELYLHETHSS